MKYFRHLLSFLFALSLFHSVRAIELSDSANITLVTCSPGEELYSAFGHNGIRVTDYKQGFDVVFNYGTFDFNQPGFYINFVRGRMRYMLSVEDFETFAMQYEYSRRSVLEQQLRLTPDERKQVFAFLFNNAKPENREYLYDFFWDNCATRPRDVFEKVLGNRLQYHTESCGFEEGKTMHDMLRIYMHERKWALTGFDFLLGMPCEVIATPRYQTFLPDYLVKYFNCATVDGQPFITGSKYLMKYPLPVIHVGFSPFHLALILLAIGLLLTYLERNNPRRFLAVDVFLFSITGLAGVLLLCLWFFTSHYAPPWNWNLLWLIPSHLPVAFWLLKKNRPQWVRYYFLATAIVQALLLIFWLVLPQPLNIAFAPLIALLGVRAFFIFYRKEKPLS